MGLTIYYFGSFRCLDQLRIEGLEEPFNVPLVQDCHATEFQTGVLGGTPYVTGQPRLGEVPFGEGLTDGLPDLRRTVGRIVS